MTAEISGMGKDRPGWMADVMQGAAAAESIGMDLHGTCLFPAVEMPDRHAGEWPHNGICDLVERDGELVRVPHQPCVDELRDWQTELHHTTEADAEAFSGPVEPQDLIDAAKRLRPRPDQNWH